MVLNPTVFPNPSGNAESFPSLRQIPEDAHSPRSLDAASDTSCSRKRRRHLEHHQGQNQKILPDRRK